MSAKRIALIVFLVFGLVAAAAPAEDDAGKALYDKKCAMCHGKDGVAKPMAKGSANLNDVDWQKANTVEAITRITADGKDKMPAYAEKLSADEIKAIATYVKKLE